MFDNATSFHGLGVDDLQKAQEFYGETLGLKVDVLDEQHGLLTLHRPGGETTLLYLSPDLQVGNYTVLNFSVDDIDATVDALTARGVEFLRYEGAPAGREGHRARARAGHRLVQGPGRATRCPC